MATGNVVITCTLTKTLNAATSTNLPRRFQIDDELELLRLLDGQIYGLDPFENFIHVDSGAPVQVAQTHAVTDKRPGFRLQFRFLCITGSRFFTAVSTICVSVRARVAMWADTTPENCATSLQQWLGMRCSISVGASTLYGWGGVHSMAPLRRVRSLLVCAHTPRLVQLPITATRESSGMISNKSSSPVPLISGAGVATIQ